MTDRAIRPFMRNMTGLRVRVGKGRDAKGWIEEDEALYHKLIHHV